MPKQAFFGGEWRSNPLKQKKFDQNLRDFYERPVFGREKTSPEVAFKRIRIFRKLSEHLFLGKSQARKTRIFRLADFWSFIAL